MGSTQQHTMLTKEARPLIQKNRAGEAEIGEDGQLSIDGCTALQTDDYIKEKFV